jgi:RHS repeat-associated protein
VEHIKSPVVSSQDYYPFGLTFNSYSRENALPNKYQFNGKELQSELGIGWLDYGARMYASEIGRWFVADPLSEKSSRWSPYTYGKDNPLRFIDPDGRFDVGITGDQKDKAFQQLQSSVKSELSLKMDGKGNVTYTKNDPDAKLSKDAKQLTNAIDDHSVKVQVKASSAKTTDDGLVVVGGAFQSAMNINRPGAKFTQTKQQVNTDQTAKIDDYFEKPGGTMLHEVTESYQAGKLVQQRGESSGDSLTDPNSVFGAAHNAATPPPGNLIGRFYDKNGNEVSPNSSSAVRANFSGKSPTKPETVLISVP